MKIRVISEFYDKYHTSTLFKVGTVLDFDDERANDIIAKKLAEPYKEPSPKVEPAQEAPKEEPATAAEPEKPAEEIAEQKPAEEPETEQQNAGKSEEAADAEPEKKRVGRPPKAKTEEAGEKAE